jgi:hypothetical protein
MSTLREAAQQALETLEALSAAENIIWVQKRAEIEVEHLRAALAQPEQAEPVLVVEKEPDYMSRGHFYEGSKPFIDPTLVWKLPIGTKLYTHPPRREWRSLTDADFDSICDNHATLQGAARAIEAKLKEKNA